MHDFVHIYDFSGFGHVSYLYAVSMVEQPERRGAE